MFTCSLFSDAVSGIYYTASNDGIMNYELIKIWREVVVAYFKVLTSHSPRGAEETNEKLNQNC